ncbi:MAG: hypothetical protein WCI74_14885 [Actinomycetes bacterium]
MRTALAIPALMVSVPVNLIRSVLMVVQSRMTAFSPTVPTSLLD